VKTADIIKDPRDIYLGEAINGSREDHHIMVSKGCKRGIFASVAFVLLWGIILGANARWYIEWKIRSYILNQYVIINEKNDVPAGVWKSFEVAGNNYNQMSVLNCTNIYDVQMMGAKPKLEPVTVTYSRYELKLNIKFRDKKFFVDYQTAQGWLPYTINLEDIPANQLKSQLPVYTINPLYVAAVARLGGSEQAMYSVLSFRVIKKFNEEFLLANSTMMTNYRILSLPAYFNYTMGQIANSSSFSVSQIQDNWGSGNIGLFENVLSNSQYRGFELYPRLNTSSSSRTSSGYLMNASAAYSLTNTNALKIWMKFTRNTTCYPSCLTDVNGLVAHFGEATAQGIASYIVNVTDAENTQFFHALKDKYSWGCDSWRCLGAAQFGAGTAVLSDPLANNARSLYNLGVLDDYLLFPSELAILSPSLGSTVNLTVAQTYRFLHVLSNPFNAQNLLLAANVYSTTLNATKLSHLLSHTPFNDTGISFSNVNTVLQYMGYLGIKYVAERDVLGRVGGLPSEGVGSTGSGLFVKRKLDEIVRGWSKSALTAQIYDISPYALGLVPIPTITETGYWGLVGMSTIESVLAQLPSPFPFRSSLWSGRGETKRARSYKLWRSREELTKVSDIIDNNGFPKPCPMYAKGGIYGGECRLWNETERVARTYNGIQFEPFKEGKSNIQQSLNYFDEIAMRQLKWNFNSEKAFHMIKVRQYYMDLEQMRNTTIVPENKRYFQTGLDYMFNMETLYDMPMYFSLPYLGRVEERVRSNFEMPEYNPQEHDPWFSLEPLTERRINSSKTWQYNLKLTSSMFNSGFWNGVFTRSSEVYWPVAWTSEKIHYPEADIKKTFNTVINARRNAWIFQVATLTACSVVGVVWLAYWIRWERMIRRDDEEEERSFTPSPNFHNRELASSVQASNIGASKHGAGSSYRVTSRLASSSSRQATRPGIQIQTSVTGTESRSTNPVSPQIDYRSPSKGQTRTSERIIVSL